MIQKNTLKPTSTTNSNEQQRRSNTDHKTSMFNEAANRLRSLTTRIDVQEGTTNHRRQATELNILRHDRQTRQKEQTKEKQSRKVILKVITERNVEFEPEENETDSEQSSNYIIEQQREIVEVTDYAQVKCANIKVYKKVYRRCQKALQQNTSHF